MVMTEAPLFDFAWTSTNAVERRMNKQILVTDGTIIGPEAKSSAKLA